MNDSSSRDAILVAATDLFARQGVEATSIKAIGAAAGVNPALIYYYFADKATLYDAVLDRMVRALPGRLADALEKVESPSEGLALVVRLQAEAFLAEPLLPRLLARELADHEASHATPLLREHAARLIGAMTRLITAGQASGEIRSDLDPTMLAISILSQVNWFCIAAPAIQTILSRPGVSHAPEAVRAFADHVVAFSSNGFMPTRGGDK